MILLLIDSAQGMRSLMLTDLLAAILPLGKKYEIDYLYDEGLERLRLEFPKTLEQWNTSSQQYSHIEDGGEVHKIIQLCYEFSILSCLPCAYVVFVTQCELASSSPLSKSLSARGWSDISRMS